MTPLILAGDIGGTKTALGLFQGLELAVVRTASYSSRDFDDLQRIIGAFLAGTAAPIAAACFGVAGAIIDGSVRPTNLPWVIDENTLRDAIPSPQVRVINDLEAAAWGVIRLTSTDFVSLQDGQTRSGHKAIIAAGTGLGEAFIIDDGGRAMVVPSEGGHADFAPRTDAEIALLAYLRREFAHVSYERVLSGPGLLNIYRFLSATRAHIEPAWLTDRLQAEDPSAVVTEIGLAGDDRNCVEAIDMFTSIYGAEAGNLALKVIARGGVYVTGGIAPRIRAKLAGGAFMAAFRDKGRFAPLMESFPVRLALQSHAPLLGAAYVAAQSLR